MGSVMKKLNSVLLSLILVITVIVSLIPIPVYADTQDRTLSSEGYQTDGTYSGGALDYTNLNADGGGYMYINTIAAQYHCWNTTDTAVSGTITNIRWSFKDQVGGNQSFVTPYVRISGVNYYGTEVNITHLSMTERYYDWANNPSTGTAWTAAAYNAAQFGLKVSSTSLLFSYFVTWTYVTITYTPPTVPSVTATAPTTYTGTSATLVGNITATGGETPDNYGFVWGTTDQGDPGNLTPADGVGGWTKGWSVGAGSYSVAQYTHATGATLTKNTTYYIRFAAHNSVGWEYSSVVSFRTLTDPSISTLAATYVASTTARLNASVTDDGKLGGGENCTVTFIYKANAGAHYANYAAILGAGGTEVVATGTYNTGGLPNYDISGLSVSTNIDFAVKITNSVSTQYGSVLYFTTESGVFVPTNFVAIPTSTTISLLWVKGTGASNTFIRYDTATYPTVVSGGLGTIYAGTGNSYLYSGLTPGQTYYFTAWGLTSGTYSASYVTVAATCLAASSTAIPTLPQPNTPGSWNLTPSTTAIADIPLAPFVNYFADSYEMPDTTMWYGLIITFAVTLGLFVYWRGNKNLMGAMLVCAMVLAIGAVSWNLVYLWVLVFFLMAGIGMAFFGLRYPS